MSSILFATLNRAPPESYNGVFVSMKTLAELLVARGHKLTLLVGGSESSDETLAPDLFLQRRSNTDALIREIHRSDADYCVWHANEHLPNPGVFGDGFKRIAIYLQNADFRSHLGLAITRNNLTWVGNSHFTSQRFSQAFGIPAQTILQPVRPDDYRVETTRRAVLFINPNVEKGAAIAINLAADLPDIPFIFQEGWGGADPVTTHFKSMTDRLANVEWRAGSTDMKTAYSEARILLVPSLWEESWGRVVSEAGVSGIPALASDRGGLPEAVGPGGKVLALDAPLEAWHNSLKMLWSDETAYASLCEKGRQHAMRQAMNLDRIIEQWITTLEAGGDTG